MLSLLALKLSHDHCSWLQNRYFRAVGFNWLVWWIILHAAGLNTKDLTSHAKFILIVEKDATFQRLLDDDFFNKVSPCIMITVCTLYFISSSYTSFKEYFSIVELLKHGQKAIIKSMWNIFNKSFLKFNYPHRNMKYMF